MNKYIRFAITGLLLGWIGWKTDWVKVGQAFATLDVGCWLAAVGVLIAAQMVSALRWQIFAKQLGMPRSFSHLTGIYFIGMYFNLLLPTSVGGDVVRVWYLDRGTGRKLRAAAAVMLDRVNGLVVLVAVACVAVLFAPDATPRWVALSVFGAAAGGVCGVLALAAFIRWGRLNEQRRQQLAFVWEVARHPRSLAATTGLSLVVQLASAAIVWLVGLGLKVEIPFGYYLVFVPMVTLLTLLPLSVNGMGVREWGCVFFLAPLGIGEPVAFTLAFLWFAVQLAVSVLGGFVYLFFGHDRGGSGQRYQTSSSESEDSSKNSDTEAADGPVNCHSNQGRAGQRQRAA